MAQFHTAIFSRKLCFALFFAKQKVGLAPVAKINFKESWLVIVPAKKDLIVCAKQLFLCLSGFMKLGPGCH